MQSFLLKQAYGGFLLSSDDFGHFFAPVHSTNETIKELDMQKIRQLASRKPMGVKKRLQV